MKRLIVGYLLGLVVGWHAHGQTVEIPSGVKSDSTHDGYLSSADWVVFNASSGCGGSPCVPPTRMVATTAPLAGGGDLSTNRTLSIPAATNAANGYLSSTNWVTFNAKAAAGANTDVTSLGAVTKLFPAADGTAALQVTKADGTTNVASFDTTNKRMGIGSTTPAVSLDIVSATANLAGLVVTSNTNNATDQLGIMAKGANANDSAIGLYNTAGGGAHWTFRASTNSNFEFIDSSAGQLDMVIKGGGSGNVGINSGTPGSKLTVGGTTQLGSAGTSFTAMGVCTIASSTLSTTATTETCTGVPASASVAVHCSGAAAFSVSAGGAVYCRATGTLSQLECNTVVANTQAMAFICSWVQP